MNKFMKYSPILLVLYLLTITNGLPKYDETANTDYKEAQNETLTRKYRPVIIIHGLTGKLNSLVNITKFIQKEHPGTKVHNLRILLGGESLAYPMWEQVRQFYDVIRPIMDKAEDGVNVIGYSQGGLIARALIEAHDHNVHNFISLSSPQAGQYGGDYYLQLLLMNTTDAYIWFYSDFYQAILSVPNYWNDPHHQDMYLKKCEFLPLLNNVVEGKENRRYKENFMKLNKVILIGGPDDGIITPWQSSHFSFFDENEKVVDFRQRRIYTEDLFGLKTLDAQKKIQIYTVKNVPHLKWHEDLNVIRNNILPWLD